MSAPLAFCHDCGLPDPPDHLIEPCAIEYGNHRIAPFPVRIVWWCAGARIDETFLRYGVIVRVPGTCLSTRRKKWEAATNDLRRRAFLAERLHLAMEGLI